MKKIGYILFVLFLDIELKITYYVYTHNKK